MNMAATLHSPRSPCPVNIRCSAQPPGASQARVPVPTAKGQRNFAAAVAAAVAPSTTPPTIEERRKAIAESGEKEPQAAFTVTEVEAAELKDFYPAKVLTVADVAPGVRCITVDAEISREFVPLDKAYTKPGQTVLVRVPAGDESQRAGAVLASSAPFSGETNFGVLYKLRGDITAGSTKAAQFALSVHSPLDLHVSEDLHAALYNARPGDVVDVGHFQATGMDLRPIMFLSRFPTLLIFASSPGVGVATARALVEADDVGSLYTPLRSDVRLYLAAPTPEHLAYQDKFSSWERLNVKVKPVVASANASWRGFVGNFASAFDEDDLEYDSATTAAVVCGSKESNAAALAVLDEAGIPRSSVIVWELSSR